MTFAIGTPHTKGAGYYLADKELSTRREADIRTCTHCQKLIKMQAWKDDGGYCSKCSAPICGPCATRAMTFGCEPFIKKIEQYAGSVMRFERFQKFAGLDALVPHNPTDTGAIIKEI